MLCIKCGASLPEGANFCHMCGKSKSHKKENLSSGPMAPAPSINFPAIANALGWPPKIELLLDIMRKKTDAGRNRIIPIRPEARDYFAHFAAIATGPLLLSGYSGQRVADNFRNREYYPLLKKLKIKKSPLIPPGTPMPPGPSKRAYLPKCFKQSWAIPTTPQRLIFTTILTQNPSFMRWILLRLLTSYYQIQKIKTTKKPCDH